MEERLISDFCLELRSFCSRLDTNCTDLHTRIEKSPAALKSTGKFVESLTKKIQAASGQLDSLKTMSMGTVSFQELFGHCNEVYKQNEARIQTLEMELEKHGYKQQNGNALHEEEADVDSWQTFESSAEPESHPDIEPEAMPFIEGLSLRDLGISASSLAALSTQNKETFQAAPRSNPAVTIEATRKLEERDSHEPNKAVSSPLMSLGDIGLSASSLAALSTDAKPVVESKAAAAAAAPQASTRSSTSFVERSNASDYAQKSGSSLIPRITADEFSGAPTWLKFQVSLELLNEFLTKLEQSLALKGPAASGVLCFKPDELVSLGYAAQIQKACLLLLVKLERLETWYHDGATTYIVSNKLR